MTYQFTASDYVYLDRADYTYTTVKQLIAETRFTYAPDSDRHVKGRPGIPGTIATLNERIATLVELRQFGVAARLIEKKVRKAYRIDGGTP